MTKDCDHEFVRAFETLESLDWILCGHGPSGVL